MNDNLRQEENISKILERSIHLFRRSGLNDLASKSEKILRNYNNAVRLR